MNINFAPLDEAQLKQLVEEGHYTSVGEAVRFAVKNLLRETPVNNPLYAAVLKGEEQYAKGQYQEYTPELRKQIRQNAHLKAKQGGKPKPEVIPNEI
jgi:Arc/MetJ-type ribon-helix-helix transcriptional regulator